MIKSLEIYPSFKQGTIIQWQLDFSARKLPFSNFEVYSSLDGDKWTKLGTTTDYFFLDTQTEVTGIQTRVAYKVVLNGDVEAITMSDLGGLSTEDRAKIKELARKEFLAQRQGGRQGYLLKRRTCGIPCQICLSGSGEATDPHCPSCYGTGFKHGYHEPIRYGVTEQNPKIRVTSRSSGLGAYKPESTKTRGVAYPHLHTLDVWVDSLTDRRYYIAEVDAITYRGIPIIYSDIKMNLAPVEDIIYEVRV